MAMSKKQKAALHLMSGGPCLRENGVLSYKGVVKIGQLQFWQLINQGMVQVAAGNKYELTSRGKRVVALLNKSLETGGKLEL